MPDPISATLKTCLDVEAADRAGPGSADRGFARFQGLDWFDPAAQSRYWFDASMDRAAQGCGYNYRYTHGGSIGKKMVHQVWR